jgi:dipeptidyl aminopeptidase/acylaminoacyl peptidase
MIKAISACAAVLAFACLAVGGPARAQPPLEAYGSLPSIEDMVLSPSGKAFAFVSVEGETRRLFIRTVAGGLVHTANLGDMKIRQLVWAGNDHLLIFLGQAMHLPHRVEITPYEIVSVVSMDIRTGHTVRVFADKGQAQGQVYGYYGSGEADGRWYGYFRSWTMGLPSEMALALFRVDLDTGDVKMAGDGGRRGYDWVTDGQGQVIARSYYDLPSNSWTLLAGADGQRVLLNKLTPLNEVETTGLGRTSDTVLVEDKSGPEDVLTETPLDGSPPRRLLEGVHVSGELRSSTTGRLLGAVGEDGKATFFDPVLQARYDAAIKPFAKYHVVLKSYDEAFDRLILFTDGADDAGAYWMVDLATGQASELAEAYPKVRPADVGPTSRIEYTAADGLKIEAVLTLPPGRKPEGLPLVVLPHGGPIGIFDKVGFDWWAQAFAARGYAVLQPNYRGSGGRGAAFRRAGYGEWGKKMQTDLSDGVAYLAKSGEIDPKRVCIVGASYGGYAALAGVTLQRGVYRCAVSYGGVSNLSHLLHREGGNHDESPTGRYMQLMLGGRWSGDPELSANSPLFHAKSADAPILLIHGKDDIVAPIVDSENMDGALKMAGKDETFVRLDGEDHWLSKGATRIAMLKAAVSFVLEHNPPAPPAQAAQVGLNTSH